MQRVTMEIEVKKYVSIVILSVEKNGRIISRTYDITRERESINLSYIKILKYGLSRLNHVNIQTVVSPDRGTT